MCVQLCHGSTFSAMTTRARPRHALLTMATSLVLLVISPLVGGISVGSTVSCSISDKEYLDISSLECVRCDDDRFVSSAVTGHVSHSCKAEHESASAWASQ